MDAIGEVLTSTITGFTAEAWRQGAVHSSVHSSGENTARSKHEPSPSFGSFLKSVSEEKRLTVYGVVYNIITGPQDQHHKPTALRMSRAELQREQPQIFALLKTEWQVVTVGYRRDGSFECGLPPYPPEVHDFVFSLDEDEILTVSENFEFIRMLSGAAGVPGDELLAATIRGAARARHDDYRYLVEAGQNVSRLLRDDYDRLGSVLRKIRP